MCPAAGDAGWQHGDHHPVAAGAAVLGARSQRGGVNIGRVIRVCEACAQLIRRDGAAVAIVERVRIRFAPAEGQFVDRNVCRLTRDDHRWRRSKGAQAREGRAQVEEQAAVVAPAQRGMAAVAVVEQLHAQHIDARLDGAADRWVGDHLLHLAPRLCR